MKKDSYARIWFRDFWEIAVHELRKIFSDGGVMLIFFVAGLAYPILYNMIYLNGLVEDTPVAVVDMADCAESRRFIREMDATREVKVTYHCMNMAEAERLMKERKVNGIIYFPSDFGDELAGMRTATVSVYCDMSSFLYYKNSLMAANHVMLAELGRIQVQRYSAAGYTGQEALQLVQPLPYGENNPYNRTFAYNIFLLSAILLVIVQQTMFYGMSLLAGTMREENKSFATLPDRLAGHGVGRVVLGRGAAYWAVYMGITMYITMIVPAMFGMPQRGSYWDTLLLDVFFVADCVFFSMTWSSLISKRETVFVLFLFMSPICLFLTGTSWPEAAFPGFWKVFSCLFPTTFGARMFMNTSVAGGDLSAGASQFACITVQTIIYFALAMVSIYVENLAIKHKDSLREARERLRNRVGIDTEADVRMIRGDVHEDVNS